MSGYVAAAISIVCFGSNFVPVKKYETGDGVFFQWVLCTAVWIVGCIVNFARTPHDGLVSSVEFYPFAMLGGALWCIGNAMAVPIIKCIGLGLGMCVWGSANLLIGWASGRFGLFGLKAEPVANPVLNYVGVALAIAGVCSFILIKAEASPKIKAKANDEKYLLADPYRVNDSVGSTSPIEEVSFIDRLPDATKRIVGLCLAVLSGCFYGVNFDPPQYILDRSNGCQVSGIDFVFSHFCGIFFMSTFIMVIYCIYRKNQPVLYPSAVLPGMISGFVWAIAQCSWFVPNESLGLIVAFPLISTGPGIIASLWGVFVFQEIKGARNFGFLALGFVIIAASVTMIAFSAETPAKTSCP